MPVRAFHIARIVFCTLALCLISPLAQAQSLQLTFDKATRFATLSGEASSLPAQDVEQQVTLYPNAYSSKSGQTENIYNFGDKTFTVVNHAAKTYTVYPLHSVPLFRARDRMMRVEKKIALYQSDQNGAQIPVTILNQDMDIDMMLASEGNNKTKDAIKTSIHAGKTVYADAKGPLVTAEKSADMLPEALGRTYAHFIIYDMTVHPFIKQELGKDKTVFKTLEFVNRDMFRNLAATYVWTLKSAAAGNDAAPQLPAGYTRTYYANPAVDHAFIESLKPRSFNAKEFQAKVNELITARKYLEAFLYGQKEKFGMAEKDAIIEAATLDPANKAAESFELPVYRAFIQTPDTLVELKQYGEILTAARDRAGEYGWLIDYILAQQTRTVLGKKQTLNGYEQERLAAANKTLLETLPQAPHMGILYQQLGELHFAAMQIPTALLFWDHLARIEPTHKAAYTFETLKKDVEKNFPEYF